MSVQSMGEIGKDFCPNFLQPFLENLNRRKPGAYSSVSQPSPKMPTLSFDGGSHEVRSSIQKTREYLEGDYKVSLRSSPLPGMKAQPLQSLFVGEVTHASYQPCS